MKNILVIFIFSLLFPINFSRIVTTFDSPGSFEVSLSDFNSSGENKFDYSTKEGLNIAYEHMITSGGILGGPDLYFFGGAEFMVGRRSNVNVSFHSIYIKPVIAVTNNFRLIFSVGLTKLNTEQANFMLDIGSLISMGIEYQVSKNTSLLLSSSVYNLFEGTYSPPSELETSPLMGIDFDGLEQVKIDMQYVKTGISVIYGFEEN